jgi:hypothetical protein
MHSPFVTARSRFGYQSGANSFLIAGTERPDFSTNAISSMPSWRISSGAWEQWQTIGNDRLQTHFLIL